MRHSRSRETKSLEQRIFEGSARSNCFRQTDCSRRLPALLKFCIISMLDILRRFHERREILSFRLRYSREMRRFAPIAASFHALSFRFVYCFRYDCTMDGFPRAIYFELYFDTRSRQVALTPLQSSRSRNFEIPSKCYSDIDDTLNRLF